MIAGLTIYAVGVTLLLVVAMLVIGKLERYASSADELIAAYRERERLQKGQAND